MTTPDPVEVLLEEYRALYQLVTFRMHSLDRRLPVAGATLTAFLGSASVLPTDARALLLAGLPVGTVWFLRTTINHARSFEDVLRRIDQIERLVNQRMGEQLLAFQSTHPSRGRSVGGRTGRESVRAVHWTCLLLLVGCAFMARPLFSSATAFEIYVAYVDVVALGLTITVRRLSRYRYGGRQGGLAAVVTRPWPSVTQA